MKITATEDSRMPAYQHLDFSTYHQKETIIGQMQI